jgi:hypothetical protein
MKFMEIKPYNLDNMRTRKQKKNYHKNKGKVRILLIVALIIVLVLIFTLTKLLNFELKFILIVPYNLKKEITIINEFNNE